MITEHQEIVAMLARNLEAIQKIEERLNSMQRQIDAISYDVSQIRQK